MAIRSSILTQKIPWTEEPGVLQSMGSRRVGYDWAAEHVQPVSWGLLCSFINRKLRHRVIYLSSCNLKICPILKPHAAQSFSDGCSERAR